MPAPSCFDSQPPWRAVNLLPGVLRAAPIQTSPLQPSVRAAVLWQQGWQCCPHPHSGMHHSPPGNAGEPGLSLEHPECLTSSLLPSCGAPGAPQQPLQPPNREHRQQELHFPPSQGCHWMRTINCSHRPASFIHCKDARVTHAGIDSGFCHFFSDFSSRAFFDKWHAHFPPALLTAWFQTMHNKCLW